MGSLLTVPAQSVLASAGVLLAAAFLAAVSRLAVITVRRLRGTGLPPIVLHGDGDGGERLVHLLSAALVDGTGRRILAPGTGGSDGQESSTRLPDTTPGAWLATLLALVRPTPVAYHVRLADARTSSQPAGAEVTVRLVREPGSSVIAAEAVRGSDEAELVDKLACLCAVQVLDQPEVRRRVPRWERWGDDPRGFEHFRRAMRQQQELADTAPSTTSADVLPAARTSSARDVQLALERASRYAPANLTLRLNEAAIEELYPHNHPGSPERRVAPHGTRPRSVAMYHRCTQMWPEHIESAYRLAIVCSRQKDQALLNWATAQFNDLLNHRLKRPELVKRYLRTWRPGCANIGERGYWASWLTPLPVPGVRRTRRRNLEAAVRIAQIAQDLYTLKRTARKAVKTTRERGKEITPATAARWRQEVSSLFSVVAAEALARTRGRAHATALGRLLHEDHSTSASFGHDAARHPSFEALRDRAEYVGAPKRSAANWHLHYNAACFLALAMQLPEQAIPEGFSRRHWREDCARAAVNQLILSLRAPDTELSKQWAGLDQDLAELWQFDRRNHWGWADFFGVPEPAAPTSPTIAPAGAELPTPSNRKSSPAPTPSAMPFPSQQPRQPEGNTPA